MPLVLFVLLNLTALLAVVLIHVARGRLTLAPLYAASALLTCLIWQLVQTGWWVEWRGVHVNAGLYGTLPAMLVGLMVVYALDGLRAAHAYLLTVAVSALASILVIELLVELAIHMPMPGAFFFPLSTHQALAVSLLLAAGFQLPVFELLRRIMPIGVAMAGGVVAGVLGFLIGYSLLTYGWQVALSNIRLEIVSALLVSIPPALVLLCYGEIATRAGLVLPARRLSRLFSVWAATEAEMREVKENFLHAKQTIGELRALNHALDTERKLRADQVARSPLAILEIDRSGAIAKFNPAAGRLFGPTLGEGAVVDDLVPGIGAMMQDRVPSRTFRLRSPGQLTTRHLHVTLLAGDNPDYGPAYSVLAEDITDREQQAFTRSIADRMRGIQLTGQVIRHDFANLMLAIEGNLSTITSALPAAPSGRVNQALRAIDSAAKRSREMMRHFGSQEPFLPPQLASFDLQLLVNEAIDLQRPAAEAAGVRIASVGLRGVVASVDHTQFVRVLMNLLGNAIRAIGNGGTIEVSVGIDGQEAIIRVVDDGIGMSQEQIDRAFDPGFSTKGDGRGGLGLAISHLIIDAHAGRLTLASMVGRGTTATVWLPLGVVDALPPGIGPVLLIMADEDKRDRLANWIQSLGGDSVEIGSATELDAVLDEDPRPWSLVVRAPSPSLSPAQRQRLRGFPQSVLGSRRNLLYQTDRCDLSPAMLKRIADFASHPDRN